MLFHYIVQLKKNLYSFLKSEFWLPYSAPELLGVHRFHIIKYCALASVL